jgi:hypothetical protein
MEKNTSRPWAVGLIFAGALARLVQQLNFAPVGGISLFSGARLRGWQAWLLPLILMAATDPLLGGYSAATPFVYASLLVNVWIGTRLRNTENPMRIGAAAAIGSLQFFVITNFGAWLGPLHTYPRTLEGLLSCYVAAIPFYGRTLLSDLLYSAALFGLHAWLSRRVAAAERVVPQTA